MDVSKHRGKTPKMDGENDGKPYEQMDDLWVPIFWETPIYIYINSRSTVRGLILSASLVAKN